MGPPHRRPVAFLAIAAMVALAGCLGIEVTHAQYRGRAGASSGFRGRSTLPRTGRTPSPRANVIPNRSGGFDMVGPRGNSRYLGKPQGNKVFHPDGTSSVVIPDAGGEATVYGPQGTHRIFREDFPYTDE